MFFYTRLGPVGIPVPDRLVDLRVLLEGVVTAAGDEDGLAVVFLHLVFEPERDFDRGLVRTGGIDDLMKLLVALGVFQQLARLLIGFHLLEQLADETLAKLCDEGFDYITVEPNTWNGQTEAIKTVGSQQCVLCSANLDEEVAYAITKAMCENTDVLAEASAALGYFDPSVAGTKALTGCDLHPGALRYYMEMGYINENGEAAK